MNLFELYSKAKKEETLHRQLLDEYFPDRNFDDEESMKHFLEALKEKCPNLERFNFIISKHRLSPKMFKTYMSKITRVEWGLSLKIADGAPESEFVRLHEVCKANGYDYFEDEKALRSGCYIEIAYTSAPIKKKNGTKVTFVFPLQCFCLLPQENLVEPLKIYDNFNLYEWAIGGPVHENNTWGVCADTKQSRILKMIVFHQMKTLNIDDLK